MEQKQPPAYYAMLALSFAFSVLAVVTLLPNPSASKPNVLGYRSVCSFAPAATALCGLLAGITCTIRNRLVSNKRAAARFKPPFVPIIVFVGLVAVAAVFGARFTAAQSRFKALIAETAPGGASFGVLADGVRQATVEEGEVSATVELTTADGRVKGLRLVEARNVEASVAEKVFEAVKTAQSSKVDVVAGATASTNVLLKAIEAAAAAAP